MHQRCDKKQTKTWEQVFVKHIILTKVRFHGQC